MRQGIGGDTVPPLGLRPALQVLRITPEAGVTVAADPRTGAAARAVPARDDCRSFPTRARRACGSARHDRKTLYTELEEMHTTNSSNVPLSARADRGVLLDINL